MDVTLALFVRVPGPSQEERRDNLTFYTSSNKSVNRCLSIGGGAERFLFFLPCGYLLTGFCLRRGHTTQADGGIRKRSSSHSSSYSFSLSLYLRLSCPLWRSLSTGFLLVSASQPLYLYRETDLSFPLFSPPSSSSTLLLSAWIPFRVDPHQVNVLHSRQVENQTFTGIIPSSYFLFCLRWDMSALAKDAELKSINYYKKPFLFGFLFLLGYACR